MKRLPAIIVSVGMASGCATSSQEFYKDPSAPSNMALCRAYLQGGEAQYKLDLQRELARRGIHAGLCKQAVDQQNAQIAAGVVLAAVVVGAAAACANSSGCGGGGGGYSAGADWDQFYNDRGYLVWACRDIRSGQFTYESNCYGKMKTDLRWPSKRAWG